jgi:hypothetical protein
LTKNRRKKLSEKQKTPPKAQKPVQRPKKVEFTMKRAKQRYRAARNMMAEGFKMPPLRKWIKEHVKQVGEFRMSEKLEKLVLR